MKTRLFRLVHSTALPNILAARFSPNRFHVTPEEAKNTSYTSTSLATCRREVMHHLGGFALHNMVEVEFEVDLERVIDLTDPKQRADLDIEPNDLLEDTEDTHAIPQSVAKRLRRKGIEGILVPSARDHDGKNMVLFLENIDPQKIRKVRETLIE